MNRVSVARFLYTGTLFVLTGMAVPPLTSVAPTLPKTTPAHDAPANQKATLSDNYLDGVVEGFYGPRWSVTNTDTILKFLSVHHLTAFIYAPKDDPYQRVKWNLLYPPAQLQYLSQIIRTAQTLKITFIYSLSPGLSIHYNNPSDLAALLRKINQIKALGVNTFMLSFDDIPTTGNLYTLAVEQSHLANEVLQSESKTTPDFRLLFTPTIYWGTTSNPYWQGLKQALNPNIDVLWTGPEVLSPTITLKDAEAAKEGIGHPLVIWDNYPVNDYTYDQPPYHPHLFLGPVVGRSSNLPGVLAGYFFNPMLQAVASEPALWTGAAYLSNPSDYHPANVWTQALRSIGAGAPNAFMLFADANVSSYLGYPSQIPLATLIRHFWGGYQKGLIAYFQNMAGADNTMTLHLINRPLLNEIQPWLTLYSSEGKAGLYAIALLHDKQQKKGVPLTAVSALAMRARSISTSPYSLDTTPLTLQFLHQALTRLGYSASIQP
ncbi:MAG: beta-N-acetylglucosaminidase domain-containing protein [Firmicutes bacterium]|nr:beta-N-acetylglucosaminidase domain-containing protein [Bacillota bacterium]